MRKGLIISNNPDNGQLMCHEIDLPIDTNMPVVSWSLDMLRKINEFSKLRRFLIRAALGRYAWRELIGLRDALDKASWDTSLPYSLEHVNYHKDKAKW